MIIFIITLYCFSQLAILWPRRWEMGKLVTAGSPPPPPCLSPRTQQQQRRTPPQPSSLQRPPRQPRQPRQLECLAVDCSQDDWYYCNVHQPVMWGPLSNTIICHEHWKIEIQRINDDFLLIIFSNIQSFTVNRKLTLKKSTWNIEKLE